jgi:C_GCAxxG_C_C family probable redox protein
MKAMSQARNEMTRADDAVACFGRGFNCAQSVLSACCEQYGMSKEEALKVSCAFGAGMGRLGGTCGAVTGAYMAIGLKYGKYLEGDEVPKEKTYAMVNEFSRQFKARNGSIVCRELLGLDIGSPEGAKVFKEKGYHANRCTRYVRDATEIVEDLLK